MRTRSLALVLSAAMCLGSVAACTGGNKDPDPTPSTPAPSESASTSAPAPVIEDPLAVSGTPAERAERISGALATETRDRSAALTAALSQTGTAIIGGDGDPLRQGVDAELGLPHWHVGASTAATSGFWVTLQDFARLIELALPPPHELQASDGYADLEALRSAASDSDASVQFLPHLIDATSQRLGGSTLAFAESAADVRMDAPTLEVVLGTLSQALWEGPAFERSAPRPGQPPFSVGIDCTDDGMEGWGIWVIEKLAGGVDLPHGKDWAGVWDRVVNEAAERGEVPEGVSGAAGRAIGKINTANDIATLLTAFYSMGSHTATVELVRTARLERVRVAIPEGGARADLRITIQSKAPADPEAQKAINCLLALTSAFGGSTSIPADRRPGVGVRIDGGREFGTDGGGFGFPANKDQPAGGGRPAQALDSLITGEDGTVTVTVMGLPRRRSVPQDVPPRDADATIHVTASAEAVTGGGLIQSFLEGVLCALRPGAQCASSGGDIIRTLKFHLGEFSFPVRDYAPPRWMVIGAIDFFTPQFRQPFGAISCTDDPHGRWAVAHRPYGEPSYTPEVLLLHLTRGHVPYLQEGDDTSDVDSVTADSYGEEFDIVGEGGQKAILRVHAEPNDRPTMRLDLGRGYVVLMEATSVPATDPMPGPCKGENWREDWHK